MRFLFVMDPLASMALDRDTSFALMRGALARGHECLHCLPQELYNRGRDVFARTRRVLIDGTPSVAYTALATPFEVAELDAVFIRKDPPFDAAYLHMTQQLDLIRERVFIMNDPRGLRDANEKLFTFQFAEWMPRSLVTAEPAAIIEFLVEVGGTAVIKPLDGAGGSGVVVLRTGDNNVRSIVDVWTQEGQKLALVQEYQPEVRSGDKRVLVLSGKPLGAILRVPREDDVRANIHAGARVQASELTPLERGAIKAMAPKLVAHGLWFVGLDFIGEKLIEVNVTSPTGIQELGRFLGQKPEEEMIAWVEAQARALGKHGV